MKGTVKSFGQKAGYGFIEGDSGEIFFFHKKEWGLPMKPQSRLLVEFDPIDTEKGRRAINVVMARRKR